MRKFIYLTFCLTFVVILFSHNSFAQIAGYVSAYQIECPWECGGAIALICNGHWVHAEGTECAMVPHGTTCNPIDGSQCHGGNSGDDGSDDGGSDSDPATATPAGPAYQQPAYDHPVTIGPGGVWVDDFETIIFDESDYNRCLKEIRLTGIFGRECHKILYDVLGSSGL